MQGRVEIHGNISMRLAGPADTPFLSKIFHETRSFIYDYADAEGDYKRFVVEHQEQLRERGYGTTHPNSMDFVIEDAGVPVGRVQIDFSNDVVHVVDLAVTARARGKGIGEAVLRGIQRTAAAARAPVMLSCDHDNVAAGRLYAKLGFELHEAGAVQNWLIWYPTRQAAGV